MQTDVRAFLIDAVNSAARSTGDAPVNIIAREKTRANLLGRLTREFPGTDITEFRTALGEFEKELRRDPSMCVSITKQLRPPATGRESVDSEVWDDRLIRLLAILGREFLLRREEVLKLAKEQLGWEPTLTQQVLCAGEDRHALQWVGDQFWTRGGRENSPSRVVVKEERRGADVPMTEEELAALEVREEEIERQRGKNERNIRRIRMRFMAEMAPHVADRKRLNREFLALDKLRQEGTVFREGVLCEDRCDFAAGIVVTVDKESGRPIGVRPLKGEDKQLTMGEL